MNNRAAKWAATLFCIVGLCLGIHVQAQVISWEGGPLSVPNFKKGSFAYQLQYREVLYKDLSVSIGYLNEGHVEDDSLLTHHRDGYTLQGWYRIIDFPNRALALQVGFGGYLFFDTQSRDPNPSQDIHRFAPIASVELHGKTGIRHLLWSATLQRTNPSGTNNIKTNMALVGLGYWLGRDSDIEKMHPRGILEDWGQPSTAQFEPNEVTLFGLLSVINIRLNPKSIGGSLEYRRRFTENFDGTLTIFDEGDPKVARRKGFAPELWDERLIAPGWHFGAGVGVYVFIDRANKPPPGQTATAAAAGLVSATISHDLCENLLLRFVWDRVITSYNHDADIWRLGLGYKWGGAR